MTRALVIGAGVAGPVAAMALQRAGIDATVYEAYAGSAEHVGSFLTLQANGMDALRAVDAAGVVEDLGFATPRVTFFSGTGKRLGDGALGSERALSRTLRRADLYAALRAEALERGARIEHGKRLVGAESGPDGVRVTFADGTEAAGDLLIGCDGLRSAVRTAVDPSAPPARYVPVLNIGGEARGVRTSIEPGEYAMVFGKRAFFGWAVAPGGDVWWFANPPRRDEPRPGEVEATPPAEWRRWLLELFAGDATPATEIIEATTTELRGWPTYDVPRVPRWHRDRMIVVGDAAHATSPASGQGASMALEDAVILAQCLRDLPDAPAAFETFVARRRDRVERIVAEGNKWSNTKAAGPVARVVRDALLPAVFRRMNAKGPGNGWVYDHHIEWDEKVVA
jgi:2-polyprenyl-6-methoxyphenol hydroxylase-like FAD-dependent oxidoreductase